jgi:subtilase family serine protease
VTVFSFSSGIVMKKKLFTTLFIGFAFCINVSKVSSSNRDVFSQPEPDLTSVKQSMLANSSVEQVATFAGPVPGCETPASVACVYGLVPTVPGCPVASTTAVPTGGWGTIAVIEDCIHPGAENDLLHFSQQFGLPVCDIASGCLTIVQNPGSPVNSPCTANEYSVDIEWAHAMAPNARLIVVESKGLTEDMAKAAQYAGQLVSQAGGGLVSISYTKPEYAQETENNHYYDSPPGVVYVVSAGDFAEGARAPGSSPNVIAAGGTAFLRDANGNFIAETAWFTPGIPAGTKRGGSGGPSLYQKRPSFQNSVQKVVGHARGVPDISSLSENLCVYSTTTDPSHPWKKDGGTSFAAPTLAGIINVAGRRAPSTIDELNYIYENALKNYQSYWHDIVNGSTNYPTLRGYDFATGLGSPLGYGGK